MANFITVPLDRLAGETLSSLLEEFASRDGTDYGEQETPLVEKVAALRAKLERGDAQLLYDADSEQWDIVDREAAREILHN